MEKEEEIKQLDYQQFIDKYGEEKVKFTSYYKYSFSFANENGLCISVGGDAEDIYRLEVDVDKEYIVKQLQPSFAAMDGKTIYFSPL